ncbi:MAG: hypothetical protein KY457_13685, partial [Actinobacteria bacterium]|nr:hypothetical protein [Actinomycetota bacterium]
SRALADVGANVTDLETRLLSAAADPIYAMIIELSLTDDATEERVEEALAGVVAELQVDHTLRAIDTETY